MSVESNPNVDDPETDPFFLAADPSKTTSMVFRMLGVELSPHLVLDGRRLRSVFVTYSPLLAVKVKEYYQKLSVPPDTPNLVLAVLGRR